MFERGSPGRSLREASFARWAGESVNSLLPAGQIGGPVVMVRHLVQGGVRLRDAAAAITVSTTMQAVAQILFALLGLALFGAYAAHGRLAGWQAPALIATAVLAAFMAVFYWAQRRGLFGRLLRMASKAFSGRDLSTPTTQADAIDASVQALYRDRRKVAATFALSFIGWVVGVVRSLARAVLSRSSGELAGCVAAGKRWARRSAERPSRFPARSGAQEGGYLLLAPLVGLTGEAALALSLAKRARELALGLPGIVYLYFVERSWQRRRAPRVPVAD